MKSQIIQDKIYEIRNQKAMLDFDLAALYGVATKALNQAVKRNIIRFPEDFMFQLTLQEWDYMRSQFVTASPETSTPALQEAENQQDSPPLNWSHFVTSSPQKTDSKSQSPENQKSNPSPNSSQFVMSSPLNRNRGKSYLPYAFTEHGVTMLASILKSEKAVKMSIEVVRAFIALKQFALQHNSIVGKLHQIEERLGEHDVQLNSIYDAIENLLDEKAEQKKWQERPRIGFRQEGP